METKKSIIESSKTPKKDYWFAGYVVAGSIISIANTYNKPLTGYTASPFDPIIVLIIAIVAGCFYHRLKRKITIKNEAGRVLTTYFILLFTATAIIGFCTALADDWKSVAVNSNGESDCF